MKKDNLVIAYRGFTIVELLIVIVIIGILATVTIIAYGGIQQRAHTVALQSDLNGAANQLDIDSTTTGNYPATTSAANGGAGLKASPGTTWQYTSTTSTYCLTGTNNGISYFISNTSKIPSAGACPGDINGGNGVVANGALIQTITSANCPTTRIRTVDARDNHTYWVQQLADGKCWMLTNLAYAGAGTNTYGDVKAALTLGSGPTYTPVYYVPSSANVTSEPTAPSASTDSGATNPQYGYLYNWCAAMGEQISTSACANATTPTPNTALSICPAGWRLPVGNGGEFAALNTAINGGSTTTDPGWLATWLAQYSGGYTTGWSQQGVLGQYWSSTQTNANLAYYLTLDTGDAFTVGNNGKNWAYAIRCVGN